MVPQRTFTIHGTFSFHNRFFTVEKGPLDYLNVLHTKIFFIFKNGLLKGSLGNQNRFFYEY